DLDGGACSPEQSCNAQFSTAPDYQFCSASVDILDARPPSVILSSARICSFLATTAKDTPTGIVPGTCAEMCQQLGSRCVAALDNIPPDCTPNPDSTDTCETPRLTEICVCERR